MILVSLFHSLFRRYDSLHSCFQQSQSLVLEPPAHIDLLEVVEAAEHPGTSHPADDVDSGASVQGPGALLPHDLLEAVHAVPVLDFLPGGHHHPPLDGVDGVGGQAGRDGHSPAQEEGGQPLGLLAQQDGLQGVVQAEVEASVDEDAGAADHEAPVQTPDPVGLDRLDVDVDDAPELPGSAAVLGVHGQTRAGVVNGLHKHEGERAGASAAEDVLGELLSVAGRLGDLEGPLDLIFEGEVERLLWEVSAKERLSLELP